MCVAPVFGNDLSIEAWRKEILHLVHLLLRLSIELFSAHGTIELVVGRQLKGLS
jgi:hypothetical protein